MSEDENGTRNLEALSMEDALNILTDETRVRILIELGEAWGEEIGRPAILSFSELMDRAGVDDSGRFNYHLDKLVGTFVRKVEGGYVLHHPGHLIYQSLIAGILNDRPAGEPSRIGPCPECDGDITARYRPDHLLIMQCSACETTLDRIPVPPQMTESRDRETLVDTTIQKQYHDLSLHRRGVCYGCGGRVERTLTMNHEDWTPPFETSVYCLLTCEACHEQLITEPAHVALTTPMVAAFFADHGRDPAVTRSWDDVLARAKAEVSVVSETPMDILVPFELENDRLNVHLDDELQVTEHTRGMRE